MTERHQMRNRPSVDLTLLAAAAVVAVLLLFIAVTLVLRGTWRRGKDPRRHREVFVFPTADQPFTGRRYKVQFYDGQYRQLTDLDLWVALPSLHGPQTDATLEQLARELAAQVESRDSQRCFRPRLVVLGAAGRQLREWTVTA